MACQACRSLICFRLIRIITASSVCGVALVCRVHTLAGLQGASSRIFGLDPIESPTWRFMGSYESKWGYKWVKL